MKRYSRNMNMLSEQEVEDLGRKKVAVIGCGGLGGYVLEMLARLGVGNITAVDGDVFDETNLNRQLLSVTETLGLNKALIAQDRLYSVNPLVDVNAITQSIDEGNVEEVISGHHVIVDAVDNLETRRLLQGAASNLGIPFVHGSIAGWYGQVTTIFPGDKTLDLIYGRGQNSIEKNSEILLLRRLW